MSHYSGNIDDFGMDTVSLTGSLEARLKAVQAAGFTQIMLTAKDLVDQPGGLDAAVALVRGSGLRITGFQVLRDFEGSSGRLHDYRIGIAKSMLAMCHALDCHLLLIRASSAKTANSDTRALVRDLRQLAVLAIPMNIKIAYTAGSEAHSVKEFSQAWDLVCQADMPNLGLGLDLFELLTSGAPESELEMLDPDKLFLVQLADAMGTPDAHFRVFPGEGEHSEALATLVKRLHGLGYRGAYSFAVFNDDYLQMPLTTVAQNARRAALWLGEDVLQRSVPLPNQIRLKRAMAA